MTTCLISFCNNSIAPAVKCLPGVFHGGNNVRDNALRFFQLVHELSRVTRRRENDFHTFFDRSLDEFNSVAPDKGDIHAKRFCRS